MVDSVGTAVGSEEGDDVDASVVSLTGIVGILVGEAVGLVVGCWSRFGS